MREVIEMRACCVEGVLKCYPHETLETIIDRIAEAEVISDKLQHLAGFPRFVKKLLTLRALF